ELRTERQATPTPRVAWGDVQASTRSDGSYIAVAELALDPSRESSLSFGLPANALLARAEVEGEAALVDLKGPRRFELPLRSSTLPQVVRLVYAGVQQPGQDLVPHLESWKLDHSLTLRTDRDP